MTTQRRILVPIICAFAVLTSIVGVAAQEAQERVARSQNFTVVTSPSGGAAFGGAQGDNTFVFVSSEMSDGKPVTGAPYSAQAVNESIQTLANGNRIVRQNTASVYRDSEGRTRRDQTISVVGGYSAAGAPAQTTFINDPVAGFNYILDSKNRTARKIDVSGMISAEKKAIDGMHLKAAAIERAKGQEAGAASVEPRQRGEADRMKVEMMARSGGGPGAGPLAIGGGSGYMMMKKDAKNTQKESLGNQTIEGVQAEGTRFTTTIPAGEIGNEQPIQIVSESWYSPELQTVVMTRHSDPRMGETTYRLTNINRSEPPRSLFEVPSDYTIQETIAPGMRYKLESELRRPGTDKKDQ